MNRHGLIGDFDAFKPIRLSMDDIIAHARQAKGREAEPIERASKVVSRELGWSLVRYRLLSDELSSDLEMVGGRQHMMGNDYPDRQAVFGVLDADGEPHLVLDVILDPEPRISFVFARDGSPLSSHHVVEFLKQLDCPASWRAGADNRLSELFDVHWDEAEGTWEMQEPRHVVKVAFQRICFGTRPTLSETIDVLLLPSALHDIADPDPERAYWAKSYYRERAWGEFSRMPNSEHVRPGFSSWMNNGDPVLAKVLNTSLDRDIERLAAEQGERDDVTPVPSA